MVDLNEIDKKYRVIGEELIMIVIKVVKFLF